MKKKEKRTQNSSDRCGILAGAAVLIVFVSFITVMLLRNSYVQTKKAAIDTLTESASQSAAKLRESVNSAVNRLEGLASILEADGEPDADKAALITNSLRADTLFSDLAVRLSDGSAAKGEKDIKTGLQWSEEIPLNQSRSDVTVSRKTSSGVTGEEIIRIFVPINGTDSKLYGIIETDSLSDRYISSGFGGNSALIAFESGSLSVFMDTGSGLEIQGGALGTLDELVFAKGYSKSSFHSDIAKKLDGYTIINTPTGRMVCAYLPVGISDWYIMQAVPESILFSQLHSNNASLVAMLIATAAGLVIFAFWINGRAVKVSLRDKKAKYQVNVRDSILANALSDSSIRVFLYYKNTDKVSVLKSGETVGHAEPSGAIKNGLDHIIKSEMLSSDDARKLRNAFSLAGSGKTKKLTVCSHRGGEETFLRYTLTSAKDETGRENIIIGTARDITESEKSRRKQINIDLFRNTVVTYKTTGMEIFLESNRWKIIWNNEPLFEQLQSGAHLSNYDKDLENVILPAIHPSDRSAFSATMNRLNLLSDFRKDTSEKTLQYRIIKNAPEEEYEYRILEIHMLRDKITDEAKADIYIRNVDKSDLERFSGSAQRDKVMRMADGVFAALSDDCLQACFAELVSDKIFVISLDGKTLCRKPSASDYKDYIYSYAEENLHPEDRCLFVSNNSAEYLEKHLTESTPVVTHYRVKSDNCKNGYMPACTQVRLVSNKEGRFEITLIEKRV